MCPVCAGYVAEGRRSELRELADAHGRAFRDGAIYMAAFTLSHYRFQSARELRRAVSACWSKVIAGKSWKLAAARATCRGWVRALEVTHGRNGWHPHIHAVFFLEQQANAAEFGIWLFERWARAVARAGFGECSPAAWSFESAAHYDAVTDYVVKGNFDYELTRGHMKDAKRGGRSPFQLLADADACDGKAAQLFREFADAFKGARQVTYSMGLRAASDEELADAPAEIIGLMPSAIYRSIMFCGLAADVLEAAERGGWARVLIFLEGEGIRVPDGPAQRAA